MKYKFFILISLVLGMFFISANLFSQNQYSATVNQPNPLTTPSICIVSVTNDNKNIVVWEKPGSNFIDYFKVYRESTQQTNKWDSIGFVPYSENSVFTDSTSEPQKQSYRYKISSVDECGNETALSTTHKTMNLSILKNLNNSYSLIWDEYEGFPVNSYRIYRGTTKDDLKLIGSTAAGNFNYNDSFSPREGIYYQIEVVNSTECNLDILKTATSVYNSSRSNIASDNTTELNSCNRTDIFIYPNPFNVKTTISFSNNSYSNYILTLYNVNGIKVYTAIVTGNSVEFERGSLPEGMYLIELKGENTFKSKLIITK